MSRHSRLSKSAAMFSAAMVFCMTGTGFASDRLFKHDYSFSIPPAVSENAVVEFSADGHDLTLPGDAQIGGDGGPQATTPGTAAATFSPTLPTLTVESAKGRLRDPD